MHRKRKASDSTCGAYPVPLPVDFAAVRDQMDVEVA